MIGLYNTSAAVSMLGLFFAVLLCAFAMAGQFELAVLLSPYDPSGARVIEWLASEAG